MIKIAPSMLSADFARFGEEARAAEAAGADYLHLDIMDGHFVPNITFGPGVVEAVRRSCGLPLDVHLMIEEPERYVAEFASAGADILTVHAEASVHLHRLLCQIREAGCRPGVSLNPATPVDVVRHVLGEIDLLLVMTVEPGFGGQAYIDAMTAKIAEARRLLDDHAPHVELEVDGGINASTGPTVVAAGARVLVAGSAVFNHSSGLPGGIAALRASLAA
ncbi:MAG: ribulose-phosphate 3-epimerase [Armatimonadetes bacterium]|jgi:ribulose-phosphate 3-epimerase|nr:ribulose-phosphate 3-epimerase [Armatimonadota bacterium]